MCTVQYLLSNPNILLLTSRSLTPKVQELVLTLNLAQESKNAMRRRAVRLQKEPRGWGLKNKRKRKERVAYASLRPTETFKRACLRPTEAAGFRVRKCTNNCQLNVAGVQRRLRYAYAACFDVIQTRRMLHALCTYSTYTQTVIGILFVHGDEIHFTLTNVVFNPLTTTKNLSPNRLKIWGSMEID